MFWIKLRRVIKILMWLWLIGSFALCWYDSRPIPAHTVEFLSDRIKPELIPATERDWNNFLLTWAIVGIAPTIVLGIIRYLMPGKKSSTTSDS
jgi:hypothetical protein